MILPGTIYRTNKELKVSGTIHFNKPFSEGFNFKLPAGEEFTISIGTDPTDNFLQVWLMNSARYESEIVNKDTLKSSFYDSFSLTLKRDEIEMNCQLITDFEEAIYFYSPLDKYGEFSNFSEFGFEHENFYYPTVEHFYQSQKFYDPIYSELIRQAKTAKAAALLGKSRDHKLKENWERIKNDIMTFAVKKKFESHESIKQLLISTEDTLLIENSPYDNYWGIGQTGNGSNQLGTTLMRVRQMIKNIP